MHFQTLLVSFARHCARATTLWTRSCPAASPNAPSTPRRQRMCAKLVQNVSYYCFIWSCALCIKSIAAWGCKVYSSSKTTRVANVATLSCDAAICAVM